MALHNTFGKRVKSNGRALAAGQRCVLAIDDEELVLEMEKEMLERLGYEVIAVGSSLQALQEFHAEPGRFDLVITDMSMPNMSGASLAQRMLSARRDLPIILCTGFSELIDEKGAKSIGIAAYLSKPFSYRRFAATIYSVMRGKLGELP